MLQGGRKAAGRIYDKAPHVFTVVLVTFLATSLAWSQAAPKAGELQVQASYSGSGTIDKDHKFYVVVWDTPNFRKPDAPRPIAVKSLTAKTGTATFSEMGKSPVYVSLAYDPTGQWDAAGPPPAGTSLGLYTNGGSDPAPIEILPGKVAKISATLDDSFKMPEQ